MADSALVGTLRRASPPRARRWGVLALVPLVLLGRGLFYWHLGPSLHWTPTVELGVTRLPFRSDYLDRALIFSVLSFGKLLASFYVWVWLLALVNHRWREADPFQRMLLLLLRPAGRWHWSLLLLLAPVLAVLVWLGLHPVLVWCQAVPPAASLAVVALEGLWVGASLLLSAKYLLAIVLVGHLINSYVYVGHQAIWPFLTATAQSVLQPLRWVPLRAGRFDGAPIAALVLVFLLAGFAAQWLERSYPG
jgi:uncharacterized protein YggT (Ycf19 family)